MLIEPHPLVTNAHVGSRCMRQFGRLHAICASSNEISGLRARPAAARLAAPSRIVKSIVFFAQRSIVMLLDRSAAAAAAAAAADHSPKARERPQSARIIYRRPSEYLHKRKSR